MGRTHMPLAGMHRVRQFIPKSIAPLFFAWLCPVGANAADVMSPANGSATTGLSTAPSGRALVYFVNDLHPGEAHVYVDDRAIAILSWNTYTAVLVRPGVHLVWGSSEARWHELKDGWTYLLRLVKLGALSTAWVVDNPGSVGALVADKQLRYVITDAGVRNRMQAQAEGGYENAARAAGEMLALPRRPRSYALDLPRKGRPAQRAGR